MSTQNTAISPREMFVNYCHIGHKTSKWNPKMRQYLYGVKNGVHIFDLEQSAEMFVNVLNQVADLASSGKTILFVSTKPQTKTLLSNIAETTGMPIISQKWMGGLLTNFQTIKQRVALMRKLKDQFETGEISKYTKKEQSQFAKDLEKLTKVLGGIEKMNKVPDAIFVVDGKRDEIALTEANKLGIPVLGIMDSNVNSELYQNGVPANDDAIKSLSFILGHVEAAILANKKSTELKSSSKDAGGVRKLK
ncbi:30S ribosomal protein S2 [Candidatus Gracilibacteria bacterium]|nr:30S ribosomal protein S2 [Candidatus Gracilibacteria bacterium]